MVERARCLLAALLLTLVAGAGAAPGEVDRSFAANGIYVDPLECCGWSQASAVVALPDGRAIVAGGASDGTSIGAVVFRLSADGSLDPTFGTAGVTRLPASLDGVAALAIERLPDGRIVIAGEYRTSNGPRPFVARLGSEGALDGSFGSGGIAALGSLGIGESFVLTRGMALQADGRIVIAGSVSVANGNYSFFAARLDASGNLDAGFGVGGVARNEPSPFNSQHYRAHGVAIAADGGIVVAGDWEEFGLGIYPAAAKFTAAGALDSSFGTGGVFRRAQNPGGVRAALALADGRLLLAGHAGGTAALYQLSSGGALDPAHNGTGVATVPTDPSSRSEATGIVVDPDGYRRLLVIESVSYVESARVRRVSPAGAVDPLPVDVPAGFEVDQWNSLPRMAAGPAGTLYIAANNRREISGFAGMPTSQTVLTALVARVVGPEGSPDPSWGNLALPGVSDTVGRAYPFIGLTTASGEYDSLSVDGAGNVMLLRPASCPPVAPPGCARLTRLLPDGQVDPSVDHRITPSVTAPRSRLFSVAAPNGKILVAGTTTSGPNGWTLRRLNPDGSLDGSFTSQTLLNSDQGPYWHDGLLAAYPDGRVLFASNARLRRYLPDGQVDATFNLGNEVFDTAMTTVATRPSGAFVLGREGVAGQVQFRDASGAVDTSLGQGGAVQLVAGASVRPDHVVFQADGKVLVAGVIVGVPTSPDIPFVARIGVTGALDTSFGVNGIVRMAATYESKRKLGGLLVQPDGKLVFGGTDTVTSPPYRGWVARLNPDGSFDGGFGIGGVAAIDPSIGADTVSALAIRPDGGILVSGTMGGSVTFMNGETLQYGRFYVMKLQAQGGGRDIAPASVTAAGLGLPYSVQLIASGGTAPYTFTLHSGSLPSGITLANGVLAGTPTLAGVFAFTIRSTDANGATATRDYTLAVHSSETLTARYYATILGRSPDASGAAFWPAEVARMTQQGASASEAFYAMATAFYASGEYTSRFTSNAQYLNDLYRTFFDRDPDPSGMDFWQAELAAGMPRGAILNNFLFSAEFAGFMAGIFGAAATSRAEVSMVMDFYRGILGRLPDTQGLQYWVGRFRAAQCNGTVPAEADAISALFLGSTEYSSRQAALPGSDRTPAFVIDLYNAFLKRGGDRAGFQHWVGQLTSGAQTREQLRRAFRDSPEFQGRVSAVATAGCMQPGSR